jgi:hypothetical protein
MVRRRLTVIALSAAIGLGFALHEQPRERAWVAAHASGAAVPSGNVSARV